MLNILKIKTSNSRDKCSNDYTNKEKNLFDQKLWNNSNVLNKEDIMVQNKLDEDYKNIIYSPSSTKEWFNSVYSYNKSYIKSLITSDVLLNNLFRSYFNMLITTFKVFFKRRRNQKIRYSSNKLFVSRAELKHTNSKLTVILYVYNKKKSSIEQSIRKILLFTEIVNILMGKEKIDKKTHKNRLIGILKRRFFFFKEWNNTFFKSTDNLFKYMVPELKKRYGFLKKIYSYIKKDKNTKINRYMYRIMSSYLFRSLKNFFVREASFNYYAKAISFNRSKFSTLVLNLMDLGITNFIKKIYDKNVKIKLVELKSVHLNSDVFSSAVALKLRDRKNKAVRILRKAILQMVKIPSLHTLITFDGTIENIKKDFFLNVIKQQVVSGVRFEASGRLTRRLTAERAIFKVRYTGSLKNVRSSLNSNSSTLLRGHVKSNSQCTIINSKTRNGAFGLKGWVSSH